MLRVLQGRCTGDPDVLGSMHMGRLVWGFASRCPFRSIRFPNGNSEDFCEPPPPVSAFMCLLFFGGGRSGGSGVRSVERGCEAFRA